MSSGKHRFASCFAIAIVVSLLSAWPTGATSTKEALREFFASFDRDLVATGRLHDRVLPLAGLQELDGRPEAPVVAPERFRRALDELRQASLTTEAWPPDWPDAAALRERARIKRAAASRAALQPGAAPLVEIAVLDLAYQALRRDALDRGVLEQRPDREGGKTLLAPSAGATMDALFDARRAVAAAALPAATHHGARVRFVIPDDLLLTDHMVELAIDLDDGAGLRALEPGRPVAASYATAGGKEIRLRLVASDGAVRWTRFGYDVVALDTPPPTDVWPLTASIPYEGTAAEGEAYIYLADGHAQVAAPIVIVEGFDIDDSYDWPELYAFLNQENLLEDLRAAGRDAVVLNFASATDPIQRNAFLLVELLQTLEAQLTPDVSYAVVGASMGGLVARYALAWLETQKDGHRCDLLLSFDAPQAGADIPLGLQCWVDFFADQSDEAAFMLSRLNSPAARQMLLYHHTALSGTTAAADPLFAQLQNDLDGLGGWPVQPRLVAVVNGSGAGLDQGFGPGTQLIDYEYYSWSIDIIGNVWAVPDGGSQVVFHGLIDLIWPLPDTERIVTVSGTLPWDGAPGGYRATMAQLGETEVPYGQITALHDNHAFIPTVSALGLVGADPFADVTGAPIPTPFDAVYVPAFNQEHVAVTPESREWFLDELLGTATAVQPATPAAAATLQLAGAMPNPFNPRAEIVFALPQDGAVRLWIADVRGRRVRTLIDGEFTTGRHAAVWDGQDDNGNAPASGIYLAVLEQDGHRIAKRITLVR